MKKIIWMFAGQGAQYFHMGRSLYENEPVFREWMQRGDAVVKDLLNESVVDVIYAPRPDRFEPFTNILHTHPAILLVECAAAQMLLARGLKPDFLLGASLGELSAFVVAGALSLEAALGWVIKQAELLAYAAPIGGMMVVLEAAELMKTEPRLFEGCELAGTNFPKSFVVAALAPALADTARRLKERGISFVNLPVRYPFHSSWTDRIATPFRNLWTSIAIGRPSIPVISSQLAGVRDQVGVEDLWLALREPISFAQTVGRLEADGPYCYVDLGPSGNMATAVKYNLAPGSKSEFLPLMTPFAQEPANLERLVGKHALVAR